MDTRIIYYFIVADDEPANTSVFQGFSESLLDGQRALRVLQSLPGDILEPALPDFEMALARRIAGECAIWWIPVSLEALKHVPFDQIIPFSVVFAGPDVNIDELRSWCSTRIAPPLIIFPRNRDVDIWRMSRMSLRDHCLQVLERIRNKITGNTYDEVKKTLLEWQDLELSAPTFEVRGNHFTLLPNYMALRAASYEIDDSEDFGMDDTGDDQYIRSIVETANAVLSVRERVGVREAFKDAPPYPDVFLFAPAMYKQWLKVIPDLKDDENFSRKKFQRAFLAIQKQKGYQLILHDGDVKLLLSKDGPVKEFTYTNAYRVREIALNSTVVGLRAASHISAVLRLPNGINRVGGEVRQFAVQARSQNNQEQKRIKAFEKVQRKLLEAVPGEFIEVIQKSESGVKVISDVPLEWLPLDGIPLGISKNVSRIPVTPGNLQVGMLVPKPPILLPPSTFSEILICSAISPDDHIRKLFELVFDVFKPVWRDKLKLRVVETKCREDLVQAINSFDGAMMVFDGHGTHEDGNKSAKLWLHNEPVDVWELRDDIDRAPPIVFLSACDTHAADRSHATTASGFLSLGVRAVMGTFLPIDAKDAAAFVGRLLFRISDYIPAVTKGDQGHAVSWTDITSGMVRMLLLSDFMLRLVKFELIDTQSAMEVNKEGNLYINFAPIEPFAAVKQLLHEQHAIPMESLEEHFKATIALSTATAYVQLGNPESIVIDDPEQRLKRMTERMHQVID